MSDLTPTPAVEAEIVEDPRDAQIALLQQQLDSIKAVLPAIPEPIKVHADLEGIYDPEYGAAYAEYVPINCPTLSAGTKDPSVRLLVQILNSTIGTQLPDDDHVTPAVQQACEQFRARFNVPQEQGPEIGNVRAWFVGPNLWAAVAAIHRQNRPETTELVTV